LSSCPRCLLRRIAEPQSPVARTCHCLRSTREYSRVAPVLVPRTGPRGCIHVSSAEGQKWREPRARHRGFRRTVLAPRSSPRAGSAAATTTAIRHHHHHHHHQHRPPPSVIAVESSLSFSLTHIDSSLSHEFARSERPELSR